MPYNYTEEKPKLFTEAAQADFIKARDWVKAALSRTGAFTMGAFMQNAGIGGDSWLMMAMIDRLVELGEIHEITLECAGQNRTFIG